MQSDQSSSLKAGIFVIISGAILIIGIMVLGQRSQLFTARLTMWTQFRNARGLIPGADVRIAGVNAGIVRSVSVVTPKGKAAVVSVALDISEDYLSFVRDDSRASIRTLGPLGDKYVEIALGTPKGRELRPGEFIQPEEPLDFYEIADEMRETIERANAVAKSVADTLDRFNNSTVMQDATASAASIRCLLEGAEKGPGLVHTLLFDPEIPKMLEDFRAVMGTLRKTAEKVEAGEGNLGQLLYGESMTRAMDDLTEASAMAKGILQEIRDGDGLVHAMIYDAEQKKVFANVADAADAAKDILEEVKSGEGLTHALIYEAEHKKALESLRNAAARLDDLVSQIQEGKGTLGLLITDPSLWESLTRLLGGAEESRTLKFLIKRSARPVEEKPETGKRPEK